MRILVADDNREIRSALRLVLGELSPGCAVEEASEGAEALRLLEAQGLDLMLFDWELPDLDIERLHHDLKARSPHCPVIAMSGSPEARDPSLRAGVTYFVGTNDPPARLFDLLRQLLSQPDGGHSPT